MSIPTQFYLGEVGTLVIRACGGLIKNSSPEPAPKIPRPYSCTSTTGTSLIVKNRYYHPKRGQGQHPHPHPCGGQDVLGLPDGPPRMVQCAGMCRRASCRTPAADGGAPKRFTGAPTCGWYPCTSGSAYAFSVSEVFD